MQGPRVYIVSDVRLYREGLASCLGSHGELSVVGAGAAADVLLQLPLLAPEVLLLDVTTKDGLALPTAVASVAPKTRIVAFAVAEAAADVLACAEAGISGYIPKEASVEQVVAAVLGAVSGKLVCSPSITSMLFRRVAALSAKAGPPVSLHCLTRREREIAELLASGLPNKEIARVLRLGPATIKNHVHNILQKLKLQRRGEISSVCRLVSLEHPETRRTAERASP